MSYLLDTNILSDAIKPEPQEAVGRWVLAQLDSQLFISAVSVGEILRGILELPAGRKRQALERWYAGRDGPRSKFAGRILPFDERVAEAWGGLIAEGRRAGRPRDPIDMMIAATAIVHRLIVVSMNERDFETAVAHFNPLRP